MRAAGFAAVALAGLLFLAAAPARAQSAVANGTSTNVWVVDEDGETVATYNVVSGAWTEQATASGGQTLIDHTAGSTLIGIDPDEFGAILVNQAPFGLPALGPAAPAFSLLGLGGALADAATPELPSVVVSPAAGTYDRTIAIVIEALPPPAFVPTSLSVQYDVDGGPQQSASKPPVARLHLVADGTYTIHARAVATAGFVVFQSPITTTTFTIAGAGPITRDTDGDGIPDIVEIELGSDPLTSDFTRDTDGDGISDFEERVRGSDPDDPDSLPLDSDGDGWSDFDEGVRGTNPNDPPHLVDPDDPDRYFPSRPTARRLREVEYIWSGGFWTDDAQSVHPTPMGKVTVADLDWTLHFDPAAVPTAERLAALGLTEAELPVYLRESVVTGALVAGTIPPLRTPASEPTIVQAGRLDAEGGRDGLTLAAWADAVPDLQPAAVTGFLASQNASFTTAAEWLAGWEAYLTAYAVQPLALDVTPRTTAALALLDGLVAWHTALEPAAVVLLGDPDTDARPTEAVESLALSLAAAAPDGATPRSLDGLHAELAAQLLPGGWLEAFSADAAAVFADFDPEAATYGSETRRILAAFLQGGPEDDDALARYVSRLYTRFAQAEFDALPAPELAALVDPTGDADGDGVANEDELPKPAVAAAEPDDSNSDGDLYQDGFDPCPGEADNRCLNVEALAVDSDGDGVIDPLDNCPNVANPDQADGVGNGIGNACRYHANIEIPSFHPTVLVGTPVAFRSRPGSPFVLGALTYAWDFGDGQTSTASQPGEIVYAQPGPYTVTLEATNTLLGTTTEDFRFVTVVGSAPFVDGGGPYAVVEGQSLQLTASASSPNGGIASYAWDFGDGQGGAGNPVDHVWAQDGSYVATVTITDGAALQASEDASVMVQDSVPVASYTVVPSAGIAPLAVQFTDTSTAYDGITGRTWNFDDGSPTSMAAAPAHEFAERGLYETELAVVDGDGSPGMATHTVAVSSGLNLLADVEPDGMADVWETLRGLVVGVDDAGGNDDLDVATNVEEHRTGTLPFDGDSAPEGPGPAYLLFRDRFDDLRFDDRWSVGLETPLAESLVVESASVDLGVVRPVEESCSTTSLVSYPTFAAENAVLRARMTLGGGGELSSACSRTNRSATGSRCVSRTRERALRPCCSAASRTPQRRRRSGRPWRRRACRSSCASERRATRSPRTPTACCSARSTRRCSRRRICGRCSRLPSARPMQPTSRACSTGSRCSATATATGSAISRRTSTATAWSTRARRIRRTKTATAMVSSTERTTVPPPRTWASSTATATASATPATPTTTAAASSGSATSTRCATRSPRSAGIRTTTPPSMPTATARSGSSSSTCCAEASGTARARRACRARARVPASGRSTGPPGIRAPADGVATVGDHRSRASRTRRFLRRDGCDRPSMVARIQAGGSG